ncbi:hypothetical protein C8R44DRAFT_238358 [Mycena epipterygia]|nr:hypothetical protein C8R44DRAFT_238358 [Mycena epipterygia]
MTPLISPADALNDPQKWNADWEMLLKQRFMAFPAGPNICFESLVNELQTRTRGIDGALSDYQALRSQTCAVQRNVTAEALTHFTSDDLERKWMRAGGDVRGKHILGAMSAVCGKSRNLNEARAGAAPLASPARREGVPQSAEIHHARGRLVHPEHTDVRPTPRLGCVRRGTGRAK